MKKNSTRLMAYMIASVAITVLTVVVFETGILTEGMLCGNVQSEFLVTSIMQLITVFAIPLALRLFKFNAVRNHITQHGIKGHYRMAVLRLAMLTLPMMINMVCYYLFVKVAFAYLAIILALSLIFIIPTQRRCDSEL